VLVVDVAVSLPAPPMNSASAERFVPAPELHDVPVPVACAVVSAVVPVARPVNDETFMSIAPAAGDSATVRVVPDASPAGASAHQIANRSKPLSTCLSFVHVSDPPVSVATADVSCHQLMHANSLAPDTAAAVVAMPHDVGLGSLWPSG
jgi:hypothetical protein